jgi:hypothetical protein
VVGDSLLIVQQLELYHPPKNSKLLSIYRQARHLADQLSVGRWSHHLRAYDKVADAAANVAMNKRHSLQSLHPSPRPDLAGLDDLLLNDFLRWRSTSSERRTSEFSKSSTSGPAKSRPQGDRSGSKRGRSSPMEVEDAVVGLREKY